MSANVYLDMRKYCFRTQFKYNIVYCTGCDCARKGQKAINDQRPGERSDKLIMHALLRVET